jgi:UDP-N-acetyl-D-glucosamine dehydrogenase
LNYTARFIELASEINSQMPEYVVNKITDALNDECKSVKGSRILILGVAYKANVGDVRESPAIDVYHLLRDKGADVLFHDPHVNDLSQEGIFDQSVVLNANQLERADCVVVLTDHDIFDWTYITEYASLVVDTRHAIINSGDSRVIYL